MKYPVIIQQLISHFSSLPGIGYKTAERMVFFILSSNQIDINVFGDALKQVKKQIKICRECGNYSNQQVCEICSDNKRDKHIICIVEKVQDIFYFENTKSYQGLYHVLGGLLSPAEGINPENLNVRKLLERINQDNTQEVIMGFNPTVEGESTIIYLKKILKQNLPYLEITRLSRGLPMGGDLEYADQITLTSAIKNRNHI